MIRILYTTHQGNPASTTFTTADGASLFTNWLDDEGLDWEWIDE